MTGLACPSLHGVDSPSAKGGRIRLGVKWMGFFSFWWEAVRRTYATWPGRISTLATFLGALAWVIGKVGGLGVLMEAMIFITTLAALILAFLIMTPRNAHQIYLEECRERSNLTARVAELESQITKPGNVNEEDLKRHVGLNLAHYHQEGLELLDNIIEDDSLPPPAYSCNVEEWLDKVAKFIAGYISTAKAGFFKGVTSVEHAVFPKMAGQNTQERSEAAMRLTAHLDRLSDIMRDY